MFNNGDNSSTAPSGGGGSSALSGRGARALRNALGSPMISPPSSQTPIDHAVKMKALIQAARIQQKIENINQKMTEEEVNQMIENCAEHDEDTSKTLTRILVEKFLSKYRWYFPRVGMPNAPSLSKAYAYYEHVTLPRRIVGEQGAEHVFRRADIGDTSVKTELFNVFTTPASALIEWGTGIDLYFSTLRAMAFMLFVAGLINLPNIIFYTSSDYNPDTGANIGDIWNFTNIPRSIPTTTWTLETSAVCRTFDWVVCDKCQPPAPGAEIGKQFGIDANGTVFALRNGCDGGQLKEGMVNYATGVFLLIFLSIVSLYLGAREVRFDEDLVSGSDYTVLVSNPPPDAYDPEEWHAFFSTFAVKQVTAITIALNNGELLQKLITRRHLLRDLLLILPKEIDTNNEDDVRAAVAKLMRERAELPRGCLSLIFGTIVNYTVIPILNLLNMFLPPDKLCNEIHKVTDEIKELQKKEYKVKAVYVTFETEEGQRAALSATSACRMDVLSNNTSHVPSSVVFRDKVLEVREPCEPTSVRWKDVGASKTRRLLARFVTFFFTIGMIAFAAFLVGRTRQKYGPRFSGPLVSIFNSLIPIVVKLAMMMESHKTEGSYQTSLYLKITLFRWVNTAILTKVITPFTNTVSPNSDDILPQINAILWAEMWLTPALRMLDLGGNFTKHYFAPKAPNQEAMNSCFQGTFYNLGERYTDMTKILFVCFFYSALFPACFFFGFAILLVQYYADKFCLFRVWALTPELGSELARFSRKYFFSGSFVAFVLVSAYTWAQFPYDNICDPRKPTYGHRGPYPNVTVDGEQRDIFVQQDTNVVYCLQQWTESTGSWFPPTPNLQPDDLRWMSGTQEQLTTIYGWTAFIVLILFFVVFFGAAVGLYLLSWVRRPNKLQLKGQDQHIDFSSQLDSVAYVPQIKVDGCPFPFIACDIDNVDKGLLGWYDPVHNYDYHNMIFDVPYEGMPRPRLPDGVMEDESITNAKKASTCSSTSDLRKPIFSIIKHYPPEWTQKNLDAENYISSFALRKRKSFEKENAEI